MTVDLSDHRACSARVLIDLLHGVEVQQVGAAHGGQAHLLLSSLVGSLARMGGSEGGREGD